MKNAKYRREKEKEIVRYEKEIEKKNELTTKTYKQGKRSIYKNKK